MLKERAPGSASTSRNGLSLVWSAVRAVSLPNGRYPLSACWASVASGVAPGSPGSMGMAPPLATITAKFRPRPMKTTAIPQVYRNCGEQRHIGEQHQRHGRIEAVGVHPGQRQDLNTRRHKYTPAEPEPVMG